MSNIPLYIQAKIKFAKEGKLRELDLSYQSTSFKLKEIPRQVFKITTKAWNPRIFKSGRKSKSEFIRRHT